MDSSESLTQSWVSAAGVVEQEVRHPLQILSRCRQMKLFRCVPQSQQPYMTQSYLLLEFDEQSFDPIASSLRALVGCRTDQPVNGLPHGLLPMNKQSP
jgi:hypothetical protein